MVDRVHAQPPVNERKIRSGVPLQGGVHRIVSDGIRGEDDSVVGVNTAVLSDGSCTTTVITEMGTKYRAEHQSNHESVINARIVPVRQKKT